MTVGATTSNGRLDLGRGRGVKIITSSFICTKTKVERDDAKRDAAKGSRPTVQDHALGQEEKKSEMILRTFTRDETGGPALQSATSTKPVKHGAFTPQTPHGSKMGERLRKMA